VSKYNQVETQYKDRDCLVDALGDMGYTDVEVHEVAQNLVGYHGDLRQQKANVIVRRKHISHSANDLGFVQQEDGTFAMIVSDFDQGKHNAQWNAKLKGAYGERGAMKVARKKGFHFLGKTVVNGKTQLRFQDRRA
jgi:uncharacterized protein DUF1257